MFGEEVGSPNAVDPAQKKKWKEEALVIN